MDEPHGSDLRNKPSGMWLRQVFIGRPTMVCSMPRLRKWTEIERPNGPAPITSTSLMAMNCFPHKGVRMISALVNRYRLGLRLLALLAPFLAVVPLLAHDRHRVPHLGEGGLHVAAVDEV